MNQDALSLPPPLPFLSFSPPLSIYTCTSPRNTLGCDDHTISLCLPLLVKCARWSPECDGRIPAYKHTSLPRHLKIWALMRQIWGLLKQIQSIMHVGGRFGHSQSKSAGGWRQADDRRATVGFEMMPECTDDKPDRLQMAQTSKKNLEATVVHKSDINVMFDENNELKTNKNWIWESPPFLLFYFCI